MLRLIFYNELPFIIKNIKIERKKKNTLQFLSFFQLLFFKKVSHGSMLIEDPRLPFFSLITNSNIYIQIILQIKIYFKN